MLASLLFYISDQTSSLCLVSESQLDFSAAAGQNSTQYSEGFSK
jgi:hypothetical protein